MSHNIVPRTAEQTETLGTEQKRWGKVYAGTVDADAAAGGLKEDIDNRATVAELARVEGLVGGAAAPNYYAEDVPWSASSQTALTSPGVLWLNINGKGYKLQESVTIDTRDAAAWDTKAEARVADHAYTVGEHIVGTNASYIYECTTAGTSSTLAPTLPETVGTTYNDGSVVWTCQKNPAAAENRAGTDAYIFAVATDTLVPAFVLSENSTVPLGYTAENSRKVGGFHCLCVDAGTNISDNNNVHPLSGYVAGAVLPASVWDLKHRPKSDPEGMVYDEGLDLWVDIYLASWTGSFGSNSSEDTMKLVSKYNAVTADGGSSEVWHGAKFAQIFGRQKKRLVTPWEFECFTVGSNQGTTISGAADATTTGGHKDTAGRRMISNIGVEDGCGYIWQFGWGGGTNTGYTTADRYVKGSNADANYKVPLLGGAWANSSSCGSRCSDWNVSAAYVGAHCGARGASEPLGA